MRRDQRLFDIVQLMRDGRAHTAADLARALGVSPRTIWRDMAILSATGLPIAGERGTGYILRSVMLLPPLTLTPDEADALAEGLRHVAVGEGGAKARAARGLLTRIATLLPQAGIEVGDQS
jgi:predicted DNA-binding transcriptional regulator YafY